MKKQVKILLGVILVLATAGGSAWYFLQPLVVESITLAPRDAVSYLTEHGFVEFREDFMLFPQVAGKVVASYFSKGDLVQAGDLLV
ncbi:MAG: hypothetical protein FWF06_08350, partial [Symbiobacteriaceae bacterium]|nr:hypothetical protein [Symbiobacteriaceae bacterium]